MLRLEGNETCGCRSGNTFKLNFRDVHTVNIECVVTYEPERWNIGSHSNVGFLSNRLSTYPEHSICYISDVNNLVKSGFKFEHDGTAHGIQRCVGCRIGINWNRGMNADEEHRKANPTCPWLIRRDSGENMELFVDSRDSPYVMREIKSFGGDWCTSRYVKFCLKCNLRISQDDASPRETHSKKSPNCSWDDWNKDINEGPPCDSNWIYDVLDM